MLTSASLEPSYYANRVLSVFLDLKEKLRYQGGGSLPAYCQTKFLQCVLDNIVNAVVEAYGKGKRVC